MEVKLKSIGNYFKEKRLADKRKRATEEASQNIYPTCRTGEKGELINEIVVCGMPLFQVSAAMMEGGMSGLMMSERSSSICVMPTSKTI